MNCENCKNTHDGSYASGRFCCAKCARCYSTVDKRRSINSKVSKALTGRCNRRMERILIKCKECDIEFEDRLTSKRMYCSFKCKQIGIGRKGGMKSSQGLRSKNEILFSELCEQQFSILVNEPMFNGWDADIIIPSIKIAVLWNGIWHHKKITESHSLEQVQNRDNIKINEIRNFGYEPYIINDMGKYDPNFVKEQFNILLKYCGIMQ